MKKKLFSILFALVLVLSFSLMTAVPVSAQVDPDSSIDISGIDAVGESGNVVVTFDIDSGMVEGDELRLTFPANFEVGGATYESDTFTTGSFATCSPFGDIVYVYVASGGITPEDDGTVTISGIVAKYAADASTYTTALYSNGSEVASAVGTIGATTAATTLDATFDASEVAMVGDSTGQVTLDITFPVALRNPDTIKMTFPGNWDVSGLTKGRMGYGLDTDVTVGVDGQVVTLKLGGAQPTLSETITFEADAITPYCAATGQTVAILIEKSGGEDVVAASADTGVNIGIDDTYELEPAGTVGLTGSVVYSTYAFAYEVPDRVVANIDVVVPVTFATDVVGAVGYDAVRFSFEKTVGPGDVTFTATDTLDVEYTFTNTGVWGPEGGFPLPADYSAETLWTLNFSEAGSYTITFNCYEIGKESTPFATGSQAVTVVEPVIGILVEPTSVTFPNIVLGEATPGDSTVSLENIGDVDVHVDAELDDIVGEDVWTTGLTIAGKAVDAWFGAAAVGGGTGSQALALTVPLGTAAGEYTATLVFWVEAQ